MITVCAESVLHAAEAFGRHGEVRPLPDRGIGREDLVGADALITRSKTQVGPSLVAGTGLRFYATATAGTDHVDLPGLAGEGVAARDAGGCNANAVSEYVVAALLHFETAHGLNPRESTLGIVGHGHVGKRVERKAKALGMRTMLNDPPLADAGGAGYVPLARLLAESDVVTLHTPLTDTGPHPTRALLHAGLADQLRPGCLLINSCRGEVVTNELLLAERFRAMVLDVWDPEPEFPLEVFARVDFGSPHVAGHSFEGKLYGTEIAYRAFCEYFGLTPEWRADEHLPPDPEPLDLSGLPPKEALRRAVAACVDLGPDHELLAGAPADRRGEVFTARRRNYPLRREFPAVRVRSHGLDDEAAGTLGALGFRLVADACA